MPPRDPHDGQRTLPPRWRDASTPSRLVAFPPIAPRFDNRANPAPTPDHAESRRTRIRLSERRASAADRRCRTPERRVRRFHPALRSRDSHGMSSNPRRRQSAGRPHALRDARRGWPGSLKNNEGPRLRGLWPSRERPPPPRAATLCQHSPSWDCHAQTEGAPVRWPSVKPSLLKRLVDLDRTALDPIQTTRMAYDFRAAHDDLALGAQRDARFPAAKNQALACGNHEPLSIR